MPEHVTFQTKPELVVEMLAELHAEGRLPGWVSGDEVYGQNPTLRRDRADRLRARDTALVSRDARVRHQHARRPSGRASWIGAADDQHSLLVRRSLSDPTDLAFFYCHSPPSRRGTLPVLLAVAGRRWPIEEDFRTGKDHFARRHGRARQHPCFEDGRRRLT